MDISTEILAAIAGAATGSLLTAVVSYVLHRQSLAHERKLARQKVDLDCVAGSPITADLQDRRAAQPAMREQGRLWKRRFLMPSPKAFIA